MISIRIGFSQRGKTLTRLNKDLKIGLEESVNNGLELIRKEMINEAPSREKGNKYSQNQIISYLKIPSECIRKPSKHTGYVYIDQRKLPHIKYVLGGRKSKTYPKKGNLLVFWKPFEGRFIFTRWIRGFPANNFISRAYLKVRGPIYNSTYRHLIKAIRK